MDIDAVAADVAAAVGLAEGPAGVTDVLRAVARHEPVAVREVSRQAELPVPIVAAVCNELRARGVVDRARPVRLTAAGREALAARAGHAATSGHAGPGPGPGPEAAGPGPGTAGPCPCCGGTGGQLPAALAALAPGLAEAAAAMPAVRLELDQTHCTVGTKLRRVHRMAEAGALGGQRVILLGDDDLIALALTAFAEAGGPAACPRRLAVVDSDPELAGFLRARARPMPGPEVEIIEHDLREPLPASLLAGFDVACTDPPYTAGGAELFLSRAVSALAPGAGRHVFFSFGARKPEETLRTQRLIADMGLTVRALLPGFNSYAGAGILGGTSHLYHLRTTAGSRPAAEGRYPGPLYTADSRAAVTRPYRCAGCGLVHQVGPGARWPRIAVLKADGCPGCGGTVLRPMPLGGRGRRQAVPVTGQARGRGRHDR